MTAFQGVGCGAVTLVDYDMFILVIVAKDIISRYGAAAVGYYVSVLQTLVREVDRGLAVNLIKLPCRLFRILFLLLLAAE